MAFSLSFPKSSPPKIPPPRVLKVLNRIREGISLVHQKMVPSEVAILEMISGSWISQTLSVVAQLGVADHIASVPVPLRELADKTQSDPEALYRVLRALSTVGIFREESQRRFSLTSLGLALRDDHPRSMRHVAIFQGQMNWASWGELLYAVKSGKCPAEKVLGEKPFEHLAKHPVKAEVFDRAMTNISAMEVEAVLAAYDFSGYGVIADIGGGHGALLAAILRHNPRARGILYDLPHVVKEAVHLRDNTLAKRCQIASGSFFESVPDGASAYLMKHIIHDWSDTESLKILRNIRAQIPSNGKLLLVEAVIPGANEPHFSKFLDIEMLVVTTGKERTESEYRELLRAADFRLDRIVPSASMSSVLEASPV